VAIDVLRAFDWTPKAPVYRTETFGASGSYGRVNGESDE
jgi:hypothetical protein